MRGPALVLAALVLATGPAAASGGLSCTARDGAVDLSVASGVSRGLGGALFGFTARLRLKGSGLAPDLADIAFEREHVAHSWVVGREARLLLYREREGSAPHGYVEVTLDTRGKADPLTAAGTYAVTVHDMTGAADGAGRTRTFKGRATCTLGD